jgi:hypothetical protein
LRVTSQVFWTADTRESIHDYRRVFSRRVHEELIVAAVIDFALQRFHREDHSLLGVQASIALARGLLADSLFNRGEQRIDPVLPFKGEQLIEGQIGVSI